MAPVTKGQIYERTVVPRFDALRVDGVLRLPRADSPCRSWFCGRAAMNGFVIRCCRTRTATIILRIQ